MIITRTQMYAVHGYILAYLGGRDALKNAGIIIGDYYLIPNGIEAGFFYSGYMLLIKYVNNEFTISKYEETFRDINNHWEEVSSVTLSDPSLIGQTVRNITGKQGIGTYHAASIPLGYVR